MIRDLILKNRSCRRFDETHHVSMETLKELVDLARLSASAGNLQPLKYILSDTPERNSLVFSCLGWAAYLKEWPGPPEGERPAAYIVILGDRTIAKNFWCDHGIACQSILLGAREAGLAGCIFGAVNWKKLRESLKIPESLEPLLVLAIGKPVETAVVEAVDESGDIKYWRDEEMVHHVPKRSLEEVIVSFD